MGLTYTKTTESENGINYSVFRVKNTPFIIGICIIIFTVAQRYTNYYLLSREIFLYIALIIIAAIIVTLVVDRELAIKKYGAMIKGKEVKIKGGQTIFSKKRKEIWIQE